MSDAVKKAIEELERILKFRRLAIDSNFQTGIDDLEDLENYIYDRIEELKLEKNLTKEGAE